MRVWICEKKDQAENLAPLLGNAQRGRHCFDTADGKVVYASGHLIGDPEPAQLNPVWEKWSMETLPIIPQKWRKTAPANDYYKALLSAIGDALKGATEVVIASDPGAEGEAIVRELLEHFKYRGAIKRLWYNAVDEVSIRKAIIRLKDGSETIGLYHAALARGRSDYIFGKTLSRAYTLLARSGGDRATRHVGRVKTPTLALVVKRDMQIATFVSQTYYELELEATSGGQVVTLTHAPAKDSRIFDRAQAEQMARAASGATGSLSVVQEERKQAPRPLFNLSKLQKYASSKWGWDVDKTLEVAQSLYDKGLTTYPRTAGVYLPDEQVPSIPAVLQILGQIGPLAPHVSKLIINGHEVRPTIFNSAKLEGEEHHAIVPNPEGVAPDPKTLSDDERALYMVIAQRYVAALLPDYRYSKTTVVLEAAGIPFAAVGRTPIDRGWRSVYNGEDPDSENEESGVTLPPLKHGAPAIAGDVSLEPKKTQPPSRYTQGDLVMDMEQIAKYATDPAIKARLRETSGIGTQATRAAIIAALIAEGYLAKQGKFVVSTAVGQQHINSEVHPSLADPSLTALWEDQLADMRAQAANAMTTDTFVGQVGGMVGTIVDSLRERVAHQAATRPPSPAQAEYMTKIAAELGVEVPADARQFFGAAKAFIDQYAPVLALLPPSAKALQFAEKIAVAAGVALPDEARTSRKACTEFIEAHKAALPAGKSSKSTTRKKKK